MYCGVSCSDGLWETMSRNNLVTAQFWGTFLAPSKQMAISHWELPRINRKGAEILPNHKDQLQNTSSSLIPSHKLSETWIIILLRNSSLWMETVIYFFLFAFVAEYSPFTHKTVCGHNKPIAPNVMFSSCTGDYPSTVKSSSITPNPQGTEVKRYQMIMNL